VAGPGKHLFLAMREPEVRICRPDREPEPKPDLVVIPCNLPSSARAWRDELPASVCEQIRSGRAGVVFDGSGEGIPHAAEMAEDMHALLARLGCPPARACHVAQHRLLRRDYEAWCASRGAAPMRVLAYDFWIKWFFHACEATGEAVLERRLQAFRSRGARRSRRFVSLNWSLRPSKAYFLLRLIRDGLLDEGFVSSGGVERLAAMGKGGLHELGKRMRAMAGFEDLYAELAPFLPRLETLGRVRLGGLAEDPNGAELAADDAGLRAYDDSWFSAVTESEMGDEPARITEKPFKPLVNLHPIVVFGNPGALAMIRELGFQTFGDAIDERYDEEPDPRRRFEMAWAEFERLCRPDEAELAALERRLAETLEFNARHGLTRLPAIYRDRIDRALLDELASLIPTH
jgi:hypothetical protein